MIAYHGKISVKRKYLARVRQHRKADELIKGIYQDKDYAGTWRGCAVGCTLHSSEHDAYETELGIPRQLALLEDAIFEGLPEPTHLEWPERFLNAITVSADLRGVHHQFTIWLLLDEQHGVIRFVETDGARTLMRRIANLHERSAAGNRPPQDEWDAAWDAAFYAGRAATSAAAWDAVWAATRDVAWAAAWAAARDAAWGSARDAVWDAVRDAHYVVMADKLIGLLQSAPVAEIEVQS